MRASAMIVILFLGATGLAAWQAGCGDENHCSDVVRTGFDEHCCAGKTACKVGPSVSGCKDLQTDPRSCGACWLDCGPGTCVAGVCACPPAPVKFCPPSLTGHYVPDPVSACVDTSIDSENCGDCGVRCATDERCVGGTCVRDDR